MEAGYGAAKCLEIRMSTLFIRRKTTLVGAVSRAPTGPARSETPDMHGTSTRENREALPVSDPKVGADRPRKVMSHNLDMNAGRESDGCVVPAKCPNNGGSCAPAEGMEGRRPTKENTGQTAATQIQSWGTASAGLHRVREAATREQPFWSRFALRRHYPR